MTNEHMLTDALIRDFRQAAVDRRCIAYLQKKCLKEEKNAWSCVCSAMDWITMAVNDLNFAPDIPIAGTEGTSVIAHAMLLMRISWIKEGIAQLHRILFGTNDEWTRGDYSAFRESISDDDYFEEIRAVFSAHPTNISNHCRLVIALDEQERFYASWPATGKNGFAAYIYSNKREQPLLRLDYPYAGLEKYAKKRYEHLVCLKKKLQDDAEIPPEDRDFPFDQKVVVEIC